ncbi:GNAT family N-acetyltransferase [Deinococcus aquaticus]|uniref:GNAT family N-acetyltransferase n=1 Tax=Deinococcus aquaticus TaxID=328692 RepID=A0ABY7V6V9_9DEIO|nr:GNAT family N-acetyltransferase [Deinococcus aquaticus]WDA59677.1 GNAT family N-acetyltransferase [Deinococcus aquaticus]
MTRPTFQLRHVTDPGDPAIAAFGRVQEASYYAPDMLIPPEVFGHLITRRDPVREDRLLVAQTADGEVLGGTLYALLPLPGDVRGAVFNSFMAVTRAARGLGVGRALHRATLDGARQAGLRGVFADSVHPSRQDAADRAAEAATGVDPAARRAALHALGLRTVDLPYWQPVGGPDGGPLTDLDLLYHPLDPDEMNPDEMSPDEMSPDDRSVPLALVTGVLRAYWTGWLGGERAQAEAQALAGRAGNAERVELLAGTDTPAYWAGSAPR